MKIVINFHFYVIIFYVLAFIVSLGLTFFLYAAQITGIALAQVIQSLPPAEVVFPLNTGSEVLAEAAASKGIETLDTPDGGDLPKDLEEQASLEGASKDTTTKPTSLHSPLEGASKDTTDITPKPPEGSPSEPTKPTTWAGQLTSKIKDTASGTAGAVKSTLQIPINEGKRVWIDTVANAAKYEAEGLSVNASKMTKAGIDRYLESSVPLSDLGVETPNIKAPVFILPQPKQDGKIQFHHCVDANCFSEEYKLQTKWSGADNRMGPIAKFCVERTLELPEMKGVRCVPIPPELSGPAARMFNIPETSIYIPPNNEPVILPEESIPGSPATPSASPHNQFTR